MLSPHAGGSIWIKSSRHRNWFLLFHETSAPDVYCTFFIFYLSLHMLSFYYYHLCFLLNHPTKQKLKESCCQFTFHWKWQKKKKLWLWHVRKTLYYVVFKWYHFPCRYGCFCVNTYFFNINMYSMYVCNSWDQAPWLCFFCLFLWTVWFIVLVQYYMK